MVEKSPYELIKSFDESLWRQGLEALVVERSPESCKAIIGVLSDKVWKKRETAARFLVEWGKDIAPILCQHTSTKNFDELYWLLHILGHFDHPQAVQEIKKFLTHSDPEVRGYAVRALATQKKVEHSRWLLPLLNDQNWAVRKLTFECLMAFGQGLIPELRPLLFADKEEPLHSVVALYVKLGGEAVLQDLNQLYRDSTFAVRYSLISSMGEIDSPAGVDFIIQGLSDPSWVIRKRASECLTNMGPKIFDRLSAWFPHGDSVMKHQIVSIIVSFLGERALPLVKRFLSSPEIEYRILGIDSLGKLPGDESSRLLMKCLGDQQRIVSDYACEVLARKQNLKIDLLLEQLETEDENVRFQVIKTIGQIGGLAFNPIIRILQGGKKEERLFLLGVLQKISPNEKLIDALVQLLGDPGWPIRNAAANCLRSYGEKAVSAVVRVLNSPNEDIQFWSRRVLLSMGPGAVAVLTQILTENSDPGMTPHIISALLSMTHSEAVPAVLAFLENTDDARIKEVMAGITDISSREIVDTILNLINHPVDRVVGWLAEILKKVTKPNLRRIVLLGLNHQEDRSRHFILEALSGWKNMSEPELKTIVRQLEVEKAPRNILGIARVIGRNPLPSLVEPLRSFLAACDPNLMLEFMLALMESEKSGYEGLLAEILKTRSHGIKMDDVEKVGRILGLVYKTKPEGIISGLTSPSMAFRLCCVVALDQIREKRIALGLMENLNPQDDPVVVKRAVKILSFHFFSEDFRLKGAVTDYLLSLGPIISEPLCEVISDIENPIDRKAIIDLIESVGGTVDQMALRKKGEPKVVLSDSLLDNVLDKRKKALEELEKIDRIIQTSHTQDLTIMFTDVKGYTAFSSKASLSDVMTMLKQHDDILIPLIEKHGGKILKKIGDAFLVIFEQPQKALLTAIEIQRQLKTYNEKSGEERKLAVRIAINTGPVVRRENDVFGDAVNVASRLEGIADAEEIVVSAATHALCDGQIFEMVPGGQHRLKGIDQPVTVFKVKW